MTLEIKWYLCVNILVGAMVIIPGVSILRHKAFVPGRVTKRGVITSLTVRLGLMLWSLLILWRLTQ